jgi:hypothetical protein
LKASSSKSKLTPLKVSLAWTRRAQKTLTFHLDYSCEIVVGTRKNGNHHPDEGRFTINPVSV